MGQRLTSVFQRNDEGVQEVAFANVNAYKWPPKGGKHIISSSIK